MDLSLQFKDRYVLKKNIQHKMRITFRTNCCLSIIVIIQWPGWFWQLNCSVSTQHEQQRVAEQKM